MQRWYWRAFDVTIYASLAACFGLVLFELYSLTP
jgi:hypothetical protein